MPAYVSPAWQAHPFPQSIAPASLWKYLVCDPLFVDHTALNTANTTTELSQIESMES
jgi:hypothetical protein